MKMLVLVKQVPDTATQVKVGERLRERSTRRGSPGSSPPTTSSRWRRPCGSRRSGISPGDEVVAVTLGPERAKEALRSCPGDGSRPRHPRERPGVRGRGHARPRPGRWPPWCKLENPQLVLSGRQAIDDDMGATGAQVAEVLGWPCLSWIMEEAVSADAK